MPRRRLVMAAYGAQALLAGALVLPGVPSIWGAAVVVLLAGVAEAFVRPAFNGLLRGVLADDERVSGRSLVGVSIRSGIMAGPAVCVGVIAAAGTRMAYAITVVVFVATVASLWRVTEPRRSPAPRASFAEDIRAGVAEARRRPWVRASSSPRSTWCSSWRRHRCCCPS
ncbi:MFS transporter [Nonomuraea sp. RK-328]|nr:MFS transporter [Nonomuraea sp. RK-328]